MNCPVCRSDGERMEDDALGRYWCDECQHVFDETVVESERHLAAVATAYEPRPRRDLDL